MIITRTPFRLSFAGGGTDFREYYSKHGGSVVSTTINKYMYVAIHPYFHDKIRIKYSITEDVGSIDQIRHPVVRECLNKVSIAKGVEITSFADVPAGTGLGSSSSFTIGLLHALYAYKGQMVSKERLAREACEIEIGCLKEPIGKQDQYAAAYGGLNHIRFNGDESVDVTPILISGEAAGKLEEALRLYYVGGQRLARSILRHQKKNINSGNGKDTLAGMMGLAEKLSRDLASGDTSEIGKVLHEGWVLKKRLAHGVANDRVDAFYEKALKAGATGGKLLGAGGTGFFLLHARDHEALKNCLQCKVLPFKIEREGTKVIFYE